MIDNEIQLTCVTLLDLGFTGFWIFTLTVELCIHGYKEFRYHCSIFLPLQELLKVVAKQAEEGKVQWHHLIDYYLLLVIH